MEARIALGAELDIASGQELGELGDDLKEFMGRDRTVRPRYFVQTGVGRGIVGPASLLVPVGSPPSGSIWNVLGFSICGETDIVTSSGGKAALYIGSVPSSGQPSLADLRLPNLSVPTYSDFSNRTQWCAPSQWVFFNLVAINGIIQFVANVFIAEYREEDVISHYGK